MLKKELQEIILNGENSGVEFKRDAMPVPRTDISCLDLVRLENYLRDIINGGRLLPMPWPIGTGPVL